MLRRLVIALGALAALYGTASAQSRFDPYTTPDGARIPGIAILCLTGVGNQVAACGSQDNPLPTLAMPFQRIGDPILLPATTTPQQYQVNQPFGAKSYRGVNPCGVDIRIKTVSSLSDTVTATTGTRFLARTAETLASSPAMTNPRIVSIMAVSDPGLSGCAFELGYGNGG